jgi:membrane protein required for colicin V production
MNSLDVLLSIPLVYFVVTGIRRGFVKEALSIAITLFALLFSIGSWHVFSGPMSFFMDESSDSFGIVTGSTLFILIMIVGGFLNRYLSGLLAESFLSIPNRIFGLLFGLMKGAVILSLILQLGKPLGVPSSMAINSSMIYSPVFSSGPKVYDIFISFIPNAKSFADKVGEEIDALSDPKKESK